MESYANEAERYDNRISAVESQAVANRGEIKAILKLLLNDSNINSARKQHSVPKFKKGDTVEVIKTYVDAPKGLKGKVIDIDDTRHPSEYYVEGTGMITWVSADCLKLVKEKEQPVFKVGDKVRLMKDRSWSDYANNLAEMGVILVIERIIGSSAHLSEKGVISVYDRYGEKTPHEYSLSELELVQEEKKGLKLGSKVRVDDNCYKFVHTGYDVARFLATSELPLTVQNIEGEMVSVIVGILILNFQKTELKLL